MVYELGGPIACSVAIRWEGIFVPRAIVSPLVWQYFEIRASSTSTEDRYSYQIAMHIRFSSLELFFIV